MMMNMNNKTSGNEVIDVEENPLYDENESNSNEVVGSDDLYENYGVTSSDDNDNKNKQMYPSDCYSFLSLYGPIKNPVYFFFGLVICLFQLAFLILFVLSVLHRKLSSNGEVDNPDEGVLAQFVHSDADPLVRATQILAIISYSLFADSSLQDVVTAVETFPRFDTATNDDKTRRVIFSCLLRFIQGGMAIISSFVLVVNSSNVIEIILNFTAVNFISSIDDVAFALARSGKYGSTLEEGATSIENHPLPKCMSRSSKNRRFCYTITFTLVLMLAFIFAIMYAQVSDKFWRTTTFRVEFDKGSGFEEYTGCFAIVTMQGSSGILEKKRKIYRNSKLATAVQFGYCRDDRRWFLYKGNEPDPCLAGEDKLAQSDKTISFDISTSYGDTWTSVSGSPLDLYFIRLNDKTLADQICESFENGICDDNLNHIDSRYDGGDCCVATCSEPFCGKGKLNTAFGIAMNVSGNGFPDCIDPTMVPITIHVQNFVSSVEPKFFLSQLTEYGYNAEFRENLTANVGDLKGIREGFKGIREGFNELITWMNENDPTDYTWTKYDLSFILSTDPKIFLSQLTEYGYNADFTENFTSKFGDLKRIREDFNEFITWMNENDPIGFSWDEYNLSFILLDPKAPFLTLYCNQKNVISISMDKSMEGNLETVMVEDGAECTLEIENILNWYSRPVWYLNYTIYHDEAMQVKIDEGSSFEEGTKHFMRVQDCFLDTIFSYGYDFQKIDYSDLTRKYNWIVEHDAGNQPCSSDFSMERYGLSMMNMALTSNVSDDSELWMNADMHCTWPSVECSQGVVVNLDLTEVEGIIGYTIPTEIGILSNLQALNLYATGTIGPIPTEIGLLTELLTLSLAWNEVTGSIPTEIGLLKNLTNFDINKNDLTGSIPTEVGVLTELQNLDLSYNELTGSIPTEVGVLTELYQLNLYKNKFDGLIPSELGLLTSLFIDLGGNLLNYTVPNELAESAALGTIRLVLEHVNENDYLMDNENQNCSIDSPCANLEFCNYDKKMSGFCEDCPANASCCSYIGLPLNGPWDCKSACSINDKEEDQEECEIGGDYYYKYALDLPENETGIEI